MKTASGCSLICTLLLSACAPRAPEGPTPRIAAPAEVRALWVVRNTLDHPDSVKAMVARAHANGFNTLIVQVRGRGDAFYNARWEPRAPSIVKDRKFDPLALTIKEAHSRGITVHAWLNTHLLANMDTPPTDPRHIYNTRPDLLAVPYKLARELYAVDPKDSVFRAKIQEYTKGARDHVEGFYLSAAAPETKEHVYSIWMDVLDHYDVDGLNFDYVRYPAPDYDYSRISLDRFRLWLVPQLNDSVRTRFAALESDPLIYVDSFPSKYGDFRRAQVSELVERIYYGVKKRNPNVIVSADVFANAKDAYENRFQDWRSWLQRGFLDVAALMAYSPNTQIFRDQITVGVAAGGRDRIWAGIGAYRQPVDSAIEKIRAAREVGARGVVLFSYNSAVRKSELNPEADYLQRVMKAVFQDALVGRMQ
ncbi:MAG: family 10 glycosylhydrolase [Gemmatimonadota bacterium]|nr:family 10 glycosylhydrolase [Gemmatimonadota bacterium]